MRLSIASADAKFFLDDAMASYLNDMFYNICGIKSDREALEETPPDARSQEQKQQHTRHLEWLLKQDDELAGRFKCFLVLPEIRTVRHWMTRLWHDYRLIGNVGHSSRENVTAAEDC